MSGYGCTLCVISCCMSILFSSSPFSHRN